MRSEGKRQKGTDIGEETERREGSGRGREVGQWKCFGSAFV
jgi:hypothetical protein